MVMVVDCVFGMSPFPPTITNCTECYTPQGGTQPALCALCRQKCHTDDSSRKVFILDFRSTKQSETVKEDTGPSQDGGSVSRV